jgi:S-DNA-T family DNA segregation ATPase FtsK/SpoIIIE
MTHDDIRPDLDEADETPGLATVHHLPAVRPALEGEVLTAGEWEAMSQRHRAAARREIYTADARLVIRKSKQVATHPHTRTVLRNVLYVLAGGVVVAHRVRDSRSTARYERVMRAAELSGDREALAEWETRAAAFRAARHARRMDLLTAPVRIARGLAVSAGSSSPPPTATPPRSPARLTARSTSSPLS